ncbi:glycosyltransferase family 2 protein [Paraburkholderia sp. 40]|uniref:glycosyltransferase family 2 protein n=1 Tax=Paraburkholderia sp. 40 TaxID=2991059 RepID=UPI003D1E632A
MSHDDPSKPLVSIALATYNGRTYLPELLASLEAQSWPHLEVVVSDDASCDGTRELLASHTGRVPVRLVGDGTRPASSAISSARSPAAAATTSRSPTRTTSGRPRKSPI